MTLFKNKYRIESTRLQDWDYSSEGWYFVTICTWNREHFFGEMKKGCIIDSPQASIAIKCWKNLPHHYHNCISEEFIVMPNHVHGIIILTSDNGVETGLKPVSPCGYVDDIGRYDEKICGRETGLKPVSPCGYVDDIGRYDEKICGVETGLKPVSPCGYVDDIGRYDEKICGRETGLKPVSTEGGKRYSLSEIIRGFKTFTARRINELYNTKGKPFWQARFYDHIIRNEESLSRIREYIKQNPLMWERDKNNFENLFM